MITFLRDPLFLSTAPDGYGFTTTHAIGSCEDSAVFASPTQPWYVFARAPPAPAPDCARKVLPRVDTPTPKPYPT